MAFEIEVRKNVFSTGIFYIDENVLRYDNKEIPIRSIAGFGYMSTQTSINGIKANKQFQVKIWQHGESNPFSFSFMGAMAGGAANDKYYSITDQLWIYFGDNMLNILHQDLMRGETVEINSYIKLTSKGMVIRRKPLFGKPYEVVGPWNEMRKEAYDGIVTFKAPNVRKGRTSGSLIDKHMWLLYFYLDWLERNPSVVVELMQVPNSYRLLEKVQQ